MKNSISVVLPTHNRPDGLAAAVKSIFNQTLLPKELIVVDDGSVPLVTGEIFSDCPREMLATLVRNETSQGANNARNRGILEANSEWIAFLDDDDEYFPEKIATLTTELALHPDSEVLYHPAEILMTNEKIKYFSGAEKLNSLVDSQKQIFLRNIIGGTSMVAVKRSLLNLSGGFDDKLPAIEDWELWVRLAMLNATFHFINKPLTLYNHNTRQVSITRSSDKIDHAYELIERKYSVLHEQLNASEKNVYQQNKLKDKVFKALLNKDVGSATHYQWKLFRSSLRLFDLMFLFAIPLGVKTVFRLRSFIK